MTVAKKIIGGSPYGRGDAQVDVTRAVLLDECTVVLVGTATWNVGAGRAIGVELGGRINKSQARTQVLYLMDEDGAAALVTELIGLASRAGMGDRFLQLLNQRMDAMPEDPR